MSLSKLQRYILREVYGSRSSKLEVVKLRSFYKSEKKVPGKLEQVKIISKSVDRLIGKGLLVGFGEKTQHKWFINEIRLTSTGKKWGKKLQGEQVRLPFIK